MTSHNINFVQSIDGAVARLTPRSPRLHQLEDHRDSQSEGGSHTPTALQSYFRSVQQNSFSNNNAAAGTGNGGQQQQATVGQNGNTPPGGNNGGGGGGAYYYTQSFRSDGTGPFSPASITNAPRTAMSSFVAGTQSANTAEHHSNTTGTIGAAMTSRPSVATNMTSERLDSSRMISPRRGADYESYNNHAASGVQPTSRRHHLDHQQPTESETSTRAPVEKNKHKFVKSERPRFSCPVIALLAIQCALIVISFVTLITITGVRTDTLTTEMVREKVQVDLDFARVSVLTPLQEYEKTLLLVRNRYLTESAVRGREMCSDDTPRFNASEPFLSDGVLVRLTHPQVAYVYHLRRSKQFFNPTTGAPELCACAAIPTGVLTLVNGSNRFSAPVTQAILENNALGVLPWIARNDRIDFLYGLVRFGTPYFSWNTILYYDEDARNGFLYLIAFAPNSVIRTINGTVTQTFRPVVTGPQTLDSTLTAISTTGIAINFTSFGPILANVTPPRAGAHTSVYNLDRMELVGTSESFPLFDGSRQLYKAGKSPSDSVNAAYNSMVGDFAQTATIPSVSNGGSTMRKTAGPFRVRFDVGGRVVSSSSITTQSGINFVIIQSTPTEYYFKETEMLLKELTILGVVVGLVILFVCVVVGVSIRMPLGKMRQAMELAAAMKNDQVVSTNSFLTDLDALCAALDQMNLKLLQAREFMPQALLCDSSNEEEADDEEDVGASKMKHSKLGGGYSTSDGDDSGAEMMTQSFSKRGMHSARGTPSGHIAVPGVDIATVHTQSTATAATTAKISSNPRYTTNSLAQKRVTILAINTIGFHSKINTSAPLTIHEPTSILTNIINAICNRERGVIDSFHGDHFVISFNAARANAQGPVKALRCAMDIVSDMPSIFSSSSSSVLFSMGVATGRACVGHLGTVGMKRLSIVGKVYSKAMALERICRQYGSSAATAGKSSGNRISTGRAHHSSRVDLPDATVDCVIDSVMASEVSHTYRLQVLGAMGTVNPLIETGATLPHFPLTQLAVTNQSFQGPNLMTGSVSRSENNTFHHDNSEMRAGGVQATTTMLGIGPVASHQMPTPRNGGGNVAPASPTVAGRRGLVPMSSTYSRVPPLPHTEKELELVFAVRGVKKSPSTHGPTGAGGNSGVGGFTSADEWLYEMSRNQAGSKIEDINRAVIGYLDTLRMVAPTAANRSDPSNNINNNSQTNNRSNSSTVVPQPQESSLALSLHLLALSQSQKLPQPGVGQQQTVPAAFGHSRSTSGAALPGMTSISAAPTPPRDTVSAEANKSSTQQPDHNMMAKLALSSTTATVAVAGYALTPIPTSGITSPTAAGPLPFEYFHQVEAEIATAKAAFWDALQLVVATHSGEKQFNDSASNLRALTIDRAVLDYALTLADVGEPFNGVFCNE